MSFCWSYFVVSARVDRDGFEADGDFRNQDRVRRIRDIKDRESRVGRVDGEEPRAVGREADGPGLFTLEIDVALSAGERRGETEGNQNGEKSSESFVHRDLLCLWFWWKSYNAAARLSNPVNLFKRRAAR